jgi:hypothetical protein
MVLWAVPFLRDMGTLGGWIEEGDPSWGGFPVVDWGWGRVGGASDVSSFPSGTTSVSYRISRLSADSGVLGRERRGFDMASWASSFPVGLWCFCSGLNIVLSFRRAEEGVWVGDGVGVSLLLPG